MKVCNVNFKLCHSLLACGIWKLWFNEGNQFLPLIFQIIPTQGHDKIQKTLYYPSLGNIRILYDFENLQRFCAQPE